MSKESKKINEETSEENVSSQVEEQSEEQDTEEQGEVEEQEVTDEKGELEIELSEAKDKYLRIYSEFENFRRRTSKEKLELVSTANKGLMSDLVPVLDDFDRAISASAESDDIGALKEGIQLVHNKLKKVLDLKGLKKMEVEKGDEFDDEKHEAITQIPAEKKLEGKIVDVVEAGYTLGESVVRFAKVVVGAKQ